MGAVSRRSAALLGRLAGLSRRRRLLVLGCVLGAAALAAFGIVRLTGGDGGTVQADRPVPNQAEAGPVVLLPGYGGEARTLDVLAMHIRATGRQAIVVRLPAAGTGDLHKQAAVVEEYVSDALRDGAPSVDLIGYSAGGIVARLWSQEHDGARKARRIITIGSPHHGTTLAAAGAAALPGACPTACQQLVPGSRLLTGLVTPVAHPPAWLSLWTEQDRTVTPPASARLEGALSLSVQSVCPALKVEHSQLPANPVVVRIVLAAIGPGPLSAPTSAAC
jgi:pimeloyl-ACP methyl ester carboxylesterase